MEVNFNAGAWRCSSISDVTGPYSYALNLPQIGECRPGYLFIKPCMDGMTNFYGSKLPTTPGDMNKRVCEDGLNYLGDLLPMSGHVVAFFAKPSHCTPEMLYLRRDSNKLWSYREITESGGCRKPHLPRQCDFSG